MENSFHFTGTNSREEWISRNGDSILVGRFKKHLFLVFLFFHVLLFLSVQLKFGIIIDLLVGGNKSDIFADFIVSYAGLSITIPD